MSRLPINNHVITTRDADRRSAKRPDAAGNAKLKKVNITFHGRSAKALFREPIAGNTALGKFSRANDQAWVAQLGGDPTVGQQSAIRQATFTSILKRAAEHELIERGIFDKDGAPRPAFGAYLEAARHELAVLKFLGVERREKELTLDDIRQRYGAAPPKEDE